MVGARLMSLRIGLVADTHVPEARHTLWPQVYRAFEGVDYIFHGGDVHDLALLSEFEKIAPIYCARGNGEDGSGGRPIQPEDDRVRYAWTLEMEGLVIGLTHYIPADERPPDHTVARWCERYFAEKTPDVIVFGDTHTELIRNVGGILCVNPGSPTYPHNYDTQFGTLGFLELDAGKARASVWLINETGIEPYDWDHPPKWKL